VPRRGSDDDRCTRRKMWFLLLHKPRLRSLLILVFLLCLVAPNFFIFPIRPSDSVRSTEPQFSQGFKDVSAQKTQKPPSTVGSVGRSSGFIVHSTTNVTLYSDSVAVNVVWNGVKRFDRILRVGDRCDKSEDAFLESVQALYMPTSASGSIPT